MSLWRVLSVALSSALVASTAIGETISLRADAWCPYTCDPGAAKPGFMIEIAKMALEPAGHKVDYKVLNWARAITETRKGKFTAIVGAAKDDAPDFIYPSEAAATQNMCFFVAADSKWKFESVTSLKGIVFGAVKDYSYTPEINQYIKNPANDKGIELVAGDNPLELNVKKLQAKRIGAFIDDRDATLTYINELGGKAKTIRTAGCTSSTEIFIAFAPNGLHSKEYAKLVADKITSMRLDGTLKVLLDRYGVAEWKLK